jgi:serine/threonine protein kinase
MFIVLNIGKSKMRDKNKFTIRDYEFHEQIGSGQFASVYHAIHKPTDPIVAIKMINKELIKKETKKRKFLNEVQILKSLRHPLIAGFVDFFESNTNYFIVMEYLPNGTLHDLIQKTSQLTRMKLSECFFN